MPYADLSSQELEERLAALRGEYATHRAKGLSLNMARGKPSREQLALSLPMLDAIGAADDLIAEDGTDCANYGGFEGIPEAKRLMASMLDHDPADVLVFGNSSLNIMYDLVVAGMLYGYAGRPAWKTLPEPRWICPVPGYDRHFRIVERLGFTPVVVPMTENGPDMDEVERIVAEDDSVKGIWCVPKYSNPTGAVYADDTVRRLAAMPCAAPDFRIFWDNAYCIHHLYEDEDRQARVLDIARACEEAGHPDRYFKFASTSKVTLPGAGIAAVAASRRNLDDVIERVGCETVGYDKLNQLRHVRFLHDAHGLAAHMAKHAAIIRPKFDLVAHVLDRELAGTGAAWTHPSGGYFVSFDGLPHTAKRTVALAKEAGVTMTGAGATWPGGIDPDDRNIRIAPTLPPLEELERALEVFVCCVKIASIEAILSSRREG